MTIAVCPLCGNLVDLSPHADMGTPHVRLAVVDEKGRLARSRDGRVLYDVYHAACGFAKATAPVEDDGEGHLTAQLMLLEW